MAIDTPLENMLERIGERLYQLRIARGEKLYSAASGMGISHTVLSQVEHGRYKALSLRMLSRIAAHFGKEAEELLAPGKP